MGKWFLIALVVAGGYFSSRMLLAWSRPNSTDVSQVDFTVAAGSSAVVIADQLQSLGLIRDPLAFRLYVRKNGLAPDLQAGNFTARRDLTYAELTEVLSNGKSTEMSITIPEGYTLAQMDDLLSRKGLIEAGDLLRCATQCAVAPGLNSLEGHLFPSTYNILKTNFDLEQFMSRMHGTFKQQFAAFESDAAARNRTIEEVVIVASMIEREASNEQQMDTISGIIWKRLDEGIPLGIDATTRYEKNDWKNPLYTADFEGSSPYNTRRNAGLPPTAIGAPGLAALRAAAQPAESEWYYYLHDGTGQIHYGRTNAEHEQNKARYLK